MRVLRSRRRLGAARRADVLLAVLLLDPAFGLGVGVGRDPRRVGTHVGDETRRSFRAELDAFVQLLRDPHRGEGPHPQPARRVLLQGRRDVRRVGALGAALLLDAKDAVAGALELAEDRLRLRLVVNLELRVGFGGGCCGRTVEARQEVALGTPLGQLRVDRP